MLKISIFDKKKVMTIISFIFLFTFFYATNYSNNFLINNNPDENTSIINIKNDRFNEPKVSAHWAYMNLSTSDVNNTRFYHNSTITIEGILYNWTIGPPPSTQGIEGYKVALRVDGDLYPLYNNVTDQNGIFKIQNYTISPSMNIYTSHTIEAQIIGPIPGDITLNNNITIYANATSDLDLEIFNRNIPQLAGGIINIPGYLNYDNNSGIPNALVDYYWYNDTLPQEKWPLNQFTTTPDGSFQISIPDDNLSNTIHLNLTYMGIPSLIESFQKNISINLYRNITCVWNTVASATQGNQIVIEGQIFARNISYLKINSTEVRLWMNGASIGTASTDDNGVFKLPYSIPSGIVGSNTIEVELLYDRNINSNTTHIINIAAAPVSSSDDISSGGSDTPPPFQNFFMILIPIIIGGVAGFAVFAYFYLKKQEEESKLTKLPLEDRIRNLKILKETGRMEESLSYLFQSIYMELINGKYGRRITETETIRDFAIISVKNLNLNPATIYPFIQKVEEIIYARPFIINDKDFYETVELFSPIYFELTGYNFVLNF